MTDQQKDDASRGKRPPDSQVAPEDDQEGENGLTAGLDAIQAALDASRTPDHPTQPEPDPGSAETGGS